MKYLFICFLLVGCGKNFESLDASSFCSAGTSEAIDDEVSETSLEGDQATKLTFNLGIENGCVVDDSWSGEI